MSEWIENLSLSQISEISSKGLDLFFHHCKMELGYSYSMMKQLLASIKFLYEKVLNDSDGVDFDFNIKMKKPRRIPVVLSVQEVERFLNSFMNKSISIQQDPELGNFRI